MVARELTTDSAEHVPAWRMGRTGSKRWSAALNECLASEDGTFCTAAELDVSGGRATYQCKETAPVSDILTGAPAVEADRTWSRQDV